MSQLADKINGWGVWLRFILPVVIFIFGTILSGKLAVMEKKLDMIEGHFSNHLSDHKSIELKLENRLTCIETILIKHFKK